MTKETEKLIRYSIAFSPIFSGGLLLIFGDASDLYSQMVVGLSVLVTASLVFYNKQADNPNPDNPDHHKTEPRFVDQALIVSLWFFGAIGVLFSGLALHLETYFQTITALAVMYVLLVAFRIERLVRRTAEEEALTLDLMGKARYWHTIYRSEVEKVIGRWKDISDEKVGGLCKKIEEILIEKKKEYEPSDIMEKNIAEEIVEALAKDSVEELVKELQLKDPSQDPHKEAVKEAVEVKKEPFRRLITDECAKNLLAGKVMTEVMENIDKGKPEKELIDAYRTSMKYIDSIEEWEIEKVNRPARDIQMAKFHMQNLEKDKPQGWEMEKAKLKRQMQEWEEEKDNHQEKTDERIVKLKEFQTDFTKFINSRRQGKNLTERIAIGAIGFALVALMHLGFPEDVTTGVGVFSVHLFTLFTSTIVVFLFFRIRDLENDRRRSLHDVVPGYFGSEYSELWKEVVHRIYESPDPRWIFTVSAVTAIVYVLLLWDKLVSPFPFLY